MALSVTYEGEKMSVEAPRSTRSHSRLREDERHDGRVRESFRLKIDTHRVGSLVRSVGIRFHFSDGRERRTNSRRHLQRRASRLLLHRYRVLPLVEKWHVPFL